MSAATDLFAAAGQHDPGGRVRLPLPAAVRGRAAYDGDQDEYRYLAEYWLEDGTAADRPRRTLMVTGMNPSTAGAHCFDPTVAKIWRLARRWRCERLMMTNAHAYRATDQARLAEIDDPVGPRNDWWLRECAAAADMILMAYGTPRIPRLRSRGLKVARMLHGLGHPLHVLRLSKHGVPCHPLYLPESLQPMPWDPNA